MPLPEPGAKREPLHRRTIEIVGYRRADGLYDIEGRLHDRKDVAFPVGGRQLPPGEAGAPAARRAQEAACLAAVAAARAWRTASLLASANSAPVW